MSEKLYEKISLKTTYYTEAYRNNTYAFYIFDTFKQPLNSSLICKDTIEKEDKDSEDEDDSYKDDSEDEDDSYKDDSEDEDDKKNIYKKDVNLTDYQPYVFDTETVYRISNNTCFRLSNKGLLRQLQKRTICMKFLPFQLIKILQFKEAVTTAIHDFEEEKPVKYLQDLGELMMLGVQTPYGCVDIRQFWQIPATEILQPTKQGICLHFNDYRQFVNLLDYLYVQKVSNFQ
ncbi:Hypothetical predicted protein [Mytilus galloprovincialis]|uniref:Uncharacterized protein n=1 Tax=Mytilus galloprovincialis TaxID=29158 RepID=A0A8B6GEZ4_MYTGA|nr:Hypothetical predicted protein [Mytilus galloprovincialis]